MLRSWWRGRPQRKAISRRPTFRPGLEGLENRTLMSATLIKDINTTPVNPQPADLTNVNGTLFFTTFNGTENDLWKSDGTPGVATLVRSFVSGGGQRELRSLTAVNGRLYFVLDLGFNPGPDKSGLWRSDGTAAGTTLVKVINPGSLASLPQQLTAVGGTLYFTADDGVHGRQLWKSDGTPAGTVMLTNIAPGGTANLQSLTGAPGKVFFVATGANAHTGVWVSDGTAAGTRLDKDLSTGTLGSYPVLPTPFHGALYFFAQNGTGGWQLYRTDGTSADDGTHGNELWKWA
jgi:ELWxxDGT repeat protein